MSVTFDARSMLDGTVLVFAISYENQAERADPKAYTYAMLKAGGLWYVTGAGRVPQAAGWGAVEKWLGRDGRVIQSIKAATEWAPLWPEPVETETWGDEDEPTPGSGGSEND